MRYLIAAALWVVFVSSGQAQTPTPECRTIKSSSERLACYDKINPPVVTPVAAPAQHGATVAKGRAAADPVGDEEATMKTRLRDICLHC